MAKKCPLMGIALYLDCLECDDKVCRKMKKKKKIVIGIDQSYKNTGVSIAVDGKLKNVSSIWLDKFKTNSERRNELRHRFNHLFKKMALKSAQEACELIIIIERIRLQSQGFLNMDYIKSIGALNSIIVDVAHKYNIPVYSVDTRSWKAQIVGTSKPMKNKYGVPEEKWPTMEYVWKLGWKDTLKYQVSNQCKKNIYVENGIKYRWNDDAADSACIALYGFCNNQKLEEEH